MKDGRFYTKQLFTGFRPESVDSDVGALELLGHTENAHAHAVLSHCVSNMVTKPPENFNFIPLRNLGRIINLNMCTFLSFNLAENDDQ